jgi:hypothetical protein
MLERGSPWWLSTVVGIAAFLSLAVSVLLCRVYAGALEILLELMARGATLKSDILLWLAIAASLCVTLALWGACAWIGSASIRGGRLSIQVVALVAGLTLISVPAHVMAIVTVLGAGLGEGLR